MNAVIVEDQALVREAVRKVCEQEFGIDVVGEADSCAAAVELIAGVRAELAILDLQLADGDGLDVVAKIRETANLRPKFLVLSAYCDECTVSRADQATVDGFLDKNTTSFVALRDAISKIRLGVVETKSP